MYNAIPKSPEAFRTISEVAVELEVPQHVLRFWESRFAQVKPLKRGGKRRYYRPEDVDLLRGICSLLYRDGLTIKGVQKILREQGVRYVMELGKGSIGLLQSPRATAQLAAPTFPSEEYPNVHPLMPDQKISISRPQSLSEVERAHFEALLDELLALKERLSSTRARLSR
mgnify:CR=1 FL=1